LQKGDEASAKARIARGQEAIAVQTAAVFFNRLAHAIKAGTEE